MDPASSDDPFASAVPDVVWRFHAYEQYDGDPSKAIQALMQRVPGYSYEIYLQQFEFHLKLLFATIAAVRDASDLLKPENEARQFTDVNQGYVMERLHAAFPGEPDDFLRGYVDMVIYWYYLR